MAIARNVNYSTIQVPCLDKEQTGKLTDYINKITTKSSREEALATLELMTAMQETGIDAESYPPVDKFIPSATVIRDLSLSGVDDKTAALIIGIICEELKKNPAELVFHSITAL